MTMQNKQKNLCSLATVHTKGNLTMIYLTFTKPQFLV